MAESDKPPSNPAGECRAAGRKWEPPSAAELQGSFANYVITDLLGCGGMGAVYKGWQKSLDRFVAIKILPPEVHGKGSGFVERFKREAKAMARFAHPGIIAVFDAGETAEGLLYFIMEYVEGTDVAKLVRSAGRLPQEQALAIATHVCDALAYAHGRGVIHRDIKPSNVIIDRDGRVKVADFGLAKVRDDAGEQLTGDQVMGTPNFMAPEAMLAGGTVDPRADLYAVGVMLYQMLTGALPRGKFELPSTKVPGIDARFDAIVEYALQPDPDRRYASAPEMKTDLERIASEPAGSSILEVAAEEVEQAEDEAGEGSARNDESADAVPRFEQEVIPESAEERPGGTAPGSPRAPGWGRRAARLVGSAIAVGALAAGALQIRIAQKESQKAPELEEDGSVTVAEASKERPFVTALGMKFVPVPIPSEQGTRLLFCTCETQIEDYAVFVRLNSREWQKPSFRQGLRHPVVNVSWEDAVAFCEWLTKRGRKTGRLTQTERYRLPTDYEWSCAVGIGASEDPRKAPAERYRLVQMFPWGKTWPPPIGAGNYSGEEAKGKQVIQGQQILSGYRDGYVQTAPCGSFAPNPLGLHDLGGNVWEWCLDHAGPGGGLRLVRGGSFASGDQGSLLSSERLWKKPQTKDESVGFRVVVGEER